MFQLAGARLSETGNLAALRIDPGHDVPDGAVLAGRVHPLKNQQQRIAVGRAVKTLQRAQLRNVFSDQFLILLLRLAKGLAQSSAPPGVCSFLRPARGILLNLFSSSFLRGGAGPDGGGGPRPTSD